MMEAAIVVATESGQCRSFRHMADAHVYVDQLISLGEQVLLTVINPARDRYSLQAMVSTDHEDETRGWDRACPEREIRRWERPDGEPFDVCAWTRTGNSAIHHISVIVRPGLVADCMRDFHPREHGGHEGMARAAAAYAVDRNRQGLPTLIVTHHRLGRAWSLQTGGQP